jgi:diguanylate cyclase (GGDEF)-like protein
MFPRVAAGVSFSMDLLNCGLYDICSTTGSGGGFISLGTLDYFDAVFGSMRDRRMAGKDDSLSLPDFKDLSLPDNSVTVIKKDIVIYKSGYNWFIGLDKPLIKPYECAGAINSLIDIIYPVYHQLLKNEKTMTDRDHLTGLFTRKKFFETLSGNIKNISTNNLPVHLFYMDFNNFKAVNDILGHDMGDRVLRSISAELRTAFIGYGNIYRLGGDEFVGVTTMGLSDEKAEEVKTKIEAVTEQAPCGLYVNIAVGVVKLTHDIIENTRIASAEDKLVNSLASLAESQMYLHKKNKIISSIVCDDCPYKKEGAGC